MNRTTLLTLLCWHTLLVLLFAAACESPVSSGGGGTTTTSGHGGVPTSTSTGGTGPAAGSGGYWCDDHGEECSTSDDPVECGFPFGSDLCSGTGGGCGHRWTIEQSTCSGVADGVYGWSPGCSPEGCLCYEAFGPDTAAIQWPDCGETDPCFGLPFSIDDGRFVPDSSCSYQCTIEGPTPGNEEPREASCTGPNAESCTLTSTHDVEAG